MSRRKTRSKARARCIVETRYGADAPEGMCLQLELIRCGSPRCRQCPNGPSHGPYWYAYRKVERRTLSVYIGLELDEDKGRQRLEAKVRQMRRNKKK